MTAHNLYSAVHLGDIYTISIEIALKLFSWTPLNIIRGDRPWRGGIINLLVGSMNIVREKLII